MEPHEKHFHPENIDEEIDQFLLIDSQEEIDAQPGIRLVHEISQLYLEESRVLDRARRRLAQQIHTSSREIPASIQHAQKKTEKERTTMQENNIPWGIDSSSYSYTPKRSSLRRAMGIVTMTAAAILLIAGFALLSGIVRPGSQGTKSTTVGSAGQTHTSSRHAACPIINDPATSNSASWLPSLSWSIQGQIAYGTQTAFKIVSARNCSTVFSKSVQNANQTTWSPDGQKVAVTADNGLYIFDDNGNTLTHLSFAQLDAQQAPEEYGIRILGWSFDGHQLFFSFADANYRDVIRSLDLSQGNKTTDLAMLPANSIADLFSPDHRFAVVISRNPINQDKALELWNITQGQKIEVFSSNHNTGPDVLAISSDSTLLARDDGGNLVQIYRLSDGKRVRSFTLASTDFEHAIWSPDGKYIAAGTSSVTIYNASTGKVVTTVGRTDATHQILSIAWSPDSKGLATMTGPSKITDPSTATFDVWHLQ